MPAGGHGPGPFRVVLPSVENVAWGVCGGPVIVRIWVAAAAVFLQTVLVDLANPSDMPLPKV